MPPWPPNVHANAVTDSDFGTGLNLVMSKDGLHDSVQRTNFKRTQGLAPLKNTIDSGKSLHEAAQEPERQR